MSRLLRQIDVDTAMDLKRRPVDPETLEKASMIVEDIRNNREAAVRHHSERLGDLARGQNFVVSRDQLDVAFGGLDPDLQSLLKRAADRIRVFAETQYESLSDVDTTVTGGRAGHRWIPVANVGAYAPAGRHPLPSSVKTNLST